MEIITTTPFGRRPVTSGLLKQAQEARAEASIKRINKWELFRELCTARQAYGVSDRDLTVLNALLSFHPDEALSDNTALIVFPSNKALGERAHGMADSTLRRHLAALVGSGLLTRHDSPNGKRYAARGEGGQITRAFGFDLRPLLVQAQAIVHAAAEARAAAARMKRLREEVMLIKRDAIKLLAYAEETLSHDLSGLQEALLDAHRRSRRSLGFSKLEMLHADLADLRGQINALFYNDAEKMSANDAQTERQYQNSKADSYEIEPIQEIGWGADDVPEEPEPDKDLNVDLLPLALVLKAAPDILPYADDQIRHWHELIAAAGYVRGMMGISPDAWVQAQREMGPQVAAITVVCILQRVSEINSPGGYLRALTTKAAQDGFSPGPMVMALLNADKRAA